ncbi:uncharacterized protein CC84DRAFT_1063133, partial [Paraphaeosphaeria sporulosa]
IRSVAVPVLFHPDLHKENIIVAEEDPGIITPIIDWQSSSIEPAFWPADEVPGLAQRIPDPPDKDPNEPKREACAKVFVASIQLAWDNGAVAFREELIRTSMHLVELGFSEPCP